MEFSEFSEVSQLGRPNPSLITSSPPGADCQELYGECEITGHVALEIDTVI